MLTTIVCLVSLLGSNHPQRLEFNLTPVQVDEIRQEYPKLTLKQAVCTHLDRAIELGQEE